MADEPTDERTLEGERRELGAQLLPFAPELNGWSLEELQTAAANLEDIEELPGWKSLMDVVRAAEDQVLKTMVHGTTVSRADYARQAGFISGLRAARTALQAVRYKAHKREDDERKALADRERREEMGL